MRFEPLISPWDGEAYRHIPADSRFNVLDFSRAGSQANNRWNSVGEPTLYVAGDRGVAVAEFARHVDRDRPPAVLAGILERRLFRLHLRLTAVFDLAQPTAWEALSLDGAPQCFLNRDIARATARFIRATTPAQAMQVPSVAFLDDFTQWVLVVFLEKLDRDPRTFVLRVEADDRFSIHSGS